MGRWLGLGLGFAGWMGLSLLAGLPGVPDIPPDKTQLSRLSRTLNLLRSATPENRRPVRILFFGQSITRQAWWTEISRRLVEAYPHAAFDIRNHAISGFNADRLVAMVEHHVAAYSPDLVILHDYGKDTDMERLVARLRQSTAADILLQTDHLQAGQEWELTDPRLITGDQFVLHRNYVTLPRLAEQYDACLADIRQRWRDYLTGNGLPAGRLLSDALHLNERGNQLMAELIWRYLKPEVALPLGDPDAGPRVRSLVVTGRQWFRGRLRVSFTGSDVEVVTDREAPEVTVLLDGRPAAEEPSLYGFSAVTRAHGYYGWPALLEVGFTNRPLVEDWEMTVTEVFENPTGFRFRVEGSVTGPDGEGRSDEDFRSRSGRVVIPRHVHVMPDAAKLAELPIPVGFKARWSGQFHGTNSFRPAAPAFPGQQPTTRLFRGLPDGPHRLELLQPTAAWRGVHGIRVYSPSGRAAVAVAMPAGAEADLEVTAADAAGRLKLRWSTNQPGLWPQQSAKVGPAAQWSAVPGPAQLEDGLQRLDLPITETARFFRLGSR